MAKYFVIGDIHGKYDLLDELLELADRKYGDHRLVFLGDMIDRGPDSFKVVARIKELTETKGAIALLGNHEDMMINYVRSCYVNKDNIWMINGGPKTVKSYGREMHRYGNKQFFSAIKMSHFDWICKLPLYYETDEVFMSHAPVPVWRSRDKPLLDFRDDRHTLLWAWHGNTQYNESDFVHDHGKLAICGHVHALFDNVMDMRCYKDDNRDYHKIVYADSGAGCYFKAPLGGVSIIDGKMIDRHLVWPAIVETRSI